MAILRHTTQKFKYRALWVITVFLLCLSAQSNDTLAQSAPLKQGAMQPLVLNAESGAYNLAPHIHVTKDAKRRLSYRDIYSAYENGAPGELIRGDILNLGTGNTPHWIIFSIENQSQNSNWILSFGRHMDGRTGLIQQLMIYDQISGIKYADNITPADNPYITNRDISATFTPLSIAANSRALMFMYVVPRPGLPTTLGFRLYDEKSFNRTSQDIKNPGNAINLVFIALIGFFLAATLLHRDLSGLLFSLYYLSLLGLLHHHDTFLYNDSPHAYDITMAFCGANALLSFLANKSFFDITRAQYAQNRFLIVGALGTAAIFLTSLILPQGTAMKAVIFYSVPALAYIILTLFSLAQAGSFPAGVYRIALGWAAGFAGLFVTIMGLANILPPTEPVMSGFWYGAAAQGAFFLAALTGKSIYFEGLRRQREIESEEEKQNLLNLTQSKESAENQRLQRLIEHEREIMNELRARDVQQTEEMRRAKDAADEANRAKSAFLAVISHEIRTPMSGVMGMVRLLLDTKLSKEQKEYAQTIKDSGEAMLALLNDILDFEKIESGRMDLEYVDFDLHRLTSGIVTLMSGHAAAKGIYLKLNMTESLPRYVVGDSVRLRQVLLNLIGNAIKFTTDGGVTLHIEPGPSTRHVRFSVEDTGIGITPEAQKNLFNPFSQADSSVARKFGGTGLGLAISQRLIEAMGGKIEINSTPSHGSTFFFTILLQEGKNTEDAGTAASTSPAAPPQNTLRILLVEDNEINRKLMKEFIVRLGHETIMASSGEEAIKILEDQDIDMVLMDIALPGISGMGATKAIRALPDRKKASTPVIALTGNVREEDIRQCFAANMNGHLSKPVDPHYLKQMIEKVISGKLDNPIVLSDSTQQDITPLKKIKSEPAPPKKIKAPIAELTPLQKLAQEAEERDLDISDEEMSENSFDLAEKKEETESGNSNLFDATMVDSLCASLGNDKFSQLITEVLDQADQMTTALLEKKMPQDEKDIAARAHDLKGMAGNFGLKGLSSAAEKIERALKDKRSTDVAPLIESLPDIAQKVRLDITGWINSQKK